MEWVTFKLAFRKKGIKGNPHVSTLRNPSSPILSNSYSRYPTVLTFKNQNILEKIVNSTDIVINCRERRIFIYLRRRNKNDPLLMNDFAASSFLFFCSFVYSLFFNVLCAAHTQQKNELCRFVFQRMACAGRTVPVITTETARRCSSQASKRTNRSNVRITFFLLFCRRLSSVTFFFFFGTK